MERGEHRERDGDEPDGCSVAAVVGDGEDREGAESCGGEDLDRAEHQEPERILWCRHGVGLDGKVTHDPTIAVDADVLGGRDTTRTRSAPNVHTRRAARPRQESNLRPSD